MPLLFGYGSLINFRSVSKTLQRDLSVDDLKPATLDGFRRCWTAPASVVLQSDKTGIVRTGLFLDLRPESCTCNGVLIEASELELDRMDHREKGYSRAPVMARIGNQTVEAVTYIVPQTNKSNQGAVLEQYIRLVEAGLRDFGDAFVQEFWSSTDEVSVDSLPGRYRFEDPIQSKASGR